MRDLLEEEIKDVTPRMYEVLGRDKGAKHWISFVKSSDWERVSLFYRRQSMTPVLEQTEWKIITIN